MDEYIKRNDAIHCVESQCVDGKMWGNENAEGTLIEAYTVIDELSDIPAADVAPVVHARWTGSYNSHCSHCGEFDVSAYIKEYPNYCPHCGAKMDEDENEND